MDLKNRSQEQQSPTRTHNRKEQNNSLFKHGKIHQEYKKLLNKLN